MNIFPQRLQVVGCALVMALLALAGCGKSNVKKNLVLSGKVTYKGQPVTGGTLKLTPSDGTTPGATTQITSTGTYTLVPPALSEMKVTIETESIRGRRGGLTPTGEKRTDVDTSKVPQYVQIPSKYANLALSGLTVSIHEGKNEQDFDLTD